MERGSMSEVVSKHLSSQPQVCEDLSGAAIGFDNCFTAFLVLAAGLAASAVALVCEVGRMRLDTTAAGRRRKVAVDVRQRRKPRKIVAVREASCSVVTKMIDCVL
jgi:hypothetical protein